MSKAKKLLSVLLSCLLVLSCCVAGLTAFAEEPETAMEAVDSNLDENAADISVEDDVADAVRDYNQLIQVKDSLTPEEKEALKEAQKKIVEFGLNCADVLTSSEAVDVYTQMYNTVASAADEALGDVDLKEALNAFQSAADLLGSVDLSDTEILNRLADAVDSPEAALPDISGYERTVVTYPAKAPKAQVEKAIPKVDDLLETVMPMLGVEGGLNNMIQTQLYTSKTAGALAKTLSALGKLLLGSTQSYAATLAECLALVEPEFYYPGETEDGEPILNGAAKKLFEVASIEDEAEFEAAWEALEFEAGDFPFEDGDKEGFKDALASLFRPYGELASMIPLTNRVDEETGEVIYGGYEGLIPILEMLDLRDIVSSAEYTAFVENMTSEENDPNQLRLMEAYLRPVFDPIFNLIDDIGAAPFETVLDLLPKLGYMLKTDMLDQQIATLLDMMGMKDMVNDLLAQLAPDMFPNGLSLTTESIYGIVAPLLNNIKVKDAVIDEETGEEITPAQTVSIKLDREKFIQFIDDLGGCGEAVVRDSVAVVTEDAPYRIAIDSDKADALVVFLRWLYGEATTPENVEAFNTLIDNADMDAPVKSILKMVLSTVASKVSADDIIVLLVNALAPDVPNFDDITNKLPDIGGITDKLPGLPELPDLGGNGGIGGVVNKVIDTVKGLFGGGSDDGGNDGDNSGTSQTGDPSIPKTGGKAVMSVMALAITASAVIGAVALKKKENDE